MKELQKNFTTPEQSKRLLELGVPADSADCYIHISECVEYNFDEKHEEMYKKCEYGVIGGSGIFGNEIPALLHLFDGSPEYLPCWSVGRLQEIAKICAKEKEYYYASVDTVAHQENFVEWWVKHFTLTDNVLFDFSKLDGEQ